MLGRTTIAGTDLVVSPLCFGTAPLGSVVDQEHSDTALDRFVELGGNFIDTARMYGDWDPQAPVAASENTVGNWLRRRGRNGLVVATKGGGLDFKVGDWRNRVTPEDIGQDIRESLEHLGVQAIDLYWLHADNPEVPVAPVMEALFQHRRAGRLRYLGASNWSPQRVAEANAYAGSRDEQGFVAVQPFWGLALPNEEKSNAQGYLLHYENRFEALHASGLTMIPYNAQSAGYFTKLAEGGIDAVPQHLRDRYDNPANVARAAAVNAMAERRGVSINEIVLSYLLSQPLPTIPIFGGTDPASIVDTVKAASVRLSMSELQQLQVT